MPDVACACSVTKGSVIWFPRVLVVCLPFRRGSLALRSAAYAIAAYFVFVAIIFGTAKVLAVVAPLKDKR
jgi:hypothetical protein